MQLQRKRERDRKRARRALQLQQHAWRVHFINAISVSARLKWEQQTAKGREREGVRGKSRANEIAGGT